MTHLIEFPLEDGGTILVEAEGTSPGGETMRGLRPSHLTEDAQVTFDAAIARMKPAAEAIIDKLRGLSDPPDEVGVVFGIKLTAEAGAFIAAIGAEANYTVNLTWKRKTG
jgi:Trypsin-co-occurring domain 1